MDLFHEYAQTNYEPFILRYWDRLKGKIPIFSGMPDEAFPQLAKWMFYCVPAARKRKTIYQTFLDQRIPRLQHHLTPYTLFILNEWQYTFPGFFIPECNTPRQNGFMMLMKFFKWIQNQF
ncbi:hypothetical protein EBO34_05265 [Alteribacter keqinensis]|uniref:Uncharacterized protein n=1 Tax=Alteribacter keqinensis TaxID=2483800 RepID=A0A3M7TVR4_9BACI|nr:hypothetical protein EBO34_05265 [Alteribacter keqinensis]